LLRIVQLGEWFPQPSEALKHTKIMEVPLSRSKFICIRINNSFSNHSSSYQSSGIIFEFRIRVSRIKSVMWIFIAAFLLAEFRQLALMKAALRC
jgi:hypothetical protein